MDQPLDVTVAALRKSKSADKGKPPFAMKMKMKPKSMKMMSSQRWPRQVWGAPWQGNGQSMWAGPRARQPASGWGQGGPRFNAPKKRWAPNYSRAPWGGNPISTYAGRQAKPRYMQTAPYRNWDKRKPHYGQNLFGRGASPPRRGGDIFQPSRYDSTANLRPKRCTREHVSPSESWVADAWKQDQSRDMDVASSLVCQGIPGAVSAKEIGEEFSSKVGTVKCVLIRRGFAVIEFCRHEDARRAQETFDKGTLAGSLMRCVAVSFAEERRRKQGH